MDPPSSLPRYVFDQALSEQENFLTWCLVLARESTSRKGHMAAIVVGEGREVLSYATNTPLLFHTHPKSVPEIHAEALAVASAARRGKTLQGSTCYVTFPPCNECFKLLVAAGVTRIVYRKCLDPSSSDAVLVAAEALGVQMVGTSIRFARDPRIQHEGVWEGDIQELLEMPTEDLTPPQMDRLEAHLNEKERNADAEREDRARRFWTETSTETRERVDAWWERFHLLYRSAAKRLQAQHRGGFMRTQQKVTRREAREQSLAL